MQTIDQVQAAWAALDHQAQLEAWDGFTRSIDYGDQGFDPFYLILMPLWEAGSSPFEDQERQYDLAMVEMDLAHNEYFDAQPLAMDPNEDALWDRFHIDTANIMVMDRPF